MTADTQALVDGLARIPDVAVLRDAGDMAPHLVDWRKRHSGTTLAVVMPSTTEAVAEVVRRCVAAGVKIFPQGGNTSVCGGSVPDHDGRSVVVNLSRLNRIRAVDPADDSMVVEAGCILAHVQEAAAKVDRLFPMSLGAEGSCQIGGNIATNAGGTAVVRYGCMRDLVLGIEAVLPDGRIWNGLRTLRKNNTGYDVKSLLIGSEGTLGIITAAALRLFPRPAAFVTAMLGLPTIEAAAEAARRIRGAAAGEVSAVELISRSQMEIVLRHIPNTRLPLQRMSQWLLLVELSGSAAPEEMEETLSRSLVGLVEDGVVEDAVIAAGERQRADLWRLRHSVTEANVKEGMGLTHDIAVPVGRIPEFVRRAERALEGSLPGAAPVVVGHMGDGNLHYIAMFPHEAWSAVEDKPATASHVGHVFYDIAAELGGTFSAEHGIGSIHVGDMTRYKSPEELDVMIGIKRLLDPAGLFNPRRVLPI